MELADNGAWHLGWLTCEHGLAFEAECNRQCNPLSHLFSLMPCTTCHSPDIPALISQTPYGLLS